MKQTSLQAPVLFDVWSFILFDALEKEMGSKLLIIYIAQL